VTWVAEKDNNARRDQEKIILSQQRVVEGGRRGINQRIMNHDHVVSRRSKGSAGRSTAAKIMYHYRNGIKTTKYKYNIPWEDQQIILKHKEDRKKLGAV
jgi:hypothetical protein